MDNNMDIYLKDLEDLLYLQENYFDTLIKMGLMLENYGERQMAFDIYKKGLEKAKKAETDLSYTMLELME